MSKTSLIAILGLAGLAASVNAAGSTIIYTDAKTQSIFRVDAPLSSTELINIGASGDYRISDIDRLPDGSFIIGSGPFPEEFPSTAKMIKINSLLGATPAASVFFESDPLQNPIGVLYHKATNHVITVNNPAGNVLPQYFNDIRAFDVANPNTAKLVFTEDVFGDPLPHYRTGNRILQDPNSDDIFVTAMNGSIYSEGGGDKKNGSTIWKFAIDATTLAGTPSLFVDLGDVTQTLLPEPLREVRGIEYTPEGIFISDVFTEAIYKITQNGDGSFNSIEQVLSGLPFQELRYDPFENRMLVGTVTPDFSLYSFNLDGSGLTLLASDVDARGIYVVPAPGVAGVLALAGLAATRRRR